MRKAPMPDSAKLGAHIYKMLRRPSSQIVVEGERVSGVAGTLNIDSLYAGRYFSIFTQPRFPCVQMMHDSHDFNVYKNLTALKGR